MTASEVFLSAWIDPDQVLSIVGFNGPKEMVERLQELGFRAGQSCEYLGRAPFRGPLLVRIGSIVVALREEEAQCLSIRPL